MWIKLDDGFATHPKILRAGPMATVLQIRALCYACQNKTDGFLPAEVLPMLTIGLGVTGENMVQHQLWELSTNGYQIHDYLLWNMSREEYHAMKGKLSKAGKKGMKSRWKKDNQGYKVGYKVSDNLSDNLAITSLSTSISSLSSPNPEWLILLKKNPLYAHIDFDRELGKMQVWQSKPANQKRKLTQSFVINWINKIEPPLANGHAVALSCPHHPSKIFTDANDKRSHDQIYHPKFEG